MMNNELAPIILFVYNRPDHTRRTLEALAANAEAAFSHLYVFADGPRNGTGSEELELIDSTRGVVTTHNWCKAVTLVTRESNMGLENNVIAGISEVIGQYGKAIILEDDIVTSPYFLKYCNDGLNAYAAAKQVFSINAFMFRIDFDAPAETFLCPVATSSWGWATWADRWRLFDASPAGIAEIALNPFLAGRFNVGNQNKTVMLKYMDTWDIRWYYTAFVRNGLGLFPTRSLTANSGFDGSGTHPGNENLEQEIYTMPVNISYTDTINLGHYAKILNYVKPESVTMLQVLKNIVKKMINYKGRYR